MLTVDPAPPRQLDRSLPRELETICLKCLEKNPARRYASAAALADDLDRWQAGEPIQARPVGRLEKTVKWVRRQPTLAALGTVSVLALLVLLVGGGLFTLFLARERDRAVQAEEKAKERLRNEQIQSATSTLERALLLCEQGEINHGLLWMTRGLQTACLAEAADLEQAFRWNLGAWSREVHRLDRILSHPAAVWAVAFSPDGALLATSCADGKVRFWETGTGRQRGEPLSHPNTVRAVAFHPGGELLLTGCEDGMARFWEVATGRLVGSPLIHCPVTQPARSWPWGTGIRSVAISPDGRTLITGGYDDKARVWETATGKEGCPPLAPGGGAVFAVAFRPDGQAVLTGSQSWSLQEWRPTSGQPVGARMRHNVVYCAAYSPDSKTVAAGYLQDNSVRQWNLATGQKREVVFQHRAPVMAVCYSPDGQLVLTASQDQTARVWDAATGLPVGSTLKHTGEVESAAFSSGGRMATGSRDGMVRLWRLAPGGPLHALPHPSWVRCVAFSPDGNRLLTGSSDQLCRLWDVDQGRQIGQPLRHDHFVVGVAFASNGKTALAAIDAVDAPQLHRWDLESSRLLSAVGGQKAIPWRLASDPRGTTLVMGGLREGPIRIWDGVTGQPRGAPWRTTIGARASPSARMVRQS